MQDPVLTHAPCGVISVQAAESRVNVCRHGLLASTLSPCTSKVMGYVQSPVAADRKY
jgi:hypothetical protein